MESIIPKQVQTVVEYSTFKDGYFPVSQVPRYNLQMTILARNISNGSIYFLWYNTNQQAYQYAGVLSGTAPTDGATCTIYYFV